MAVNEVFRLDKYRHGLTARRSGRVPAVWSRGMPAEQRLAERQRKAKPRLKAPDIRTKDLRSRVRE